LSEKSQEALVNISDKVKLGNILKPILASATLFNALVNDRAIPVLFSVKYTDWEALTKAMKSVNAVVKRSVRTEVEYRILSTTGKERLFWKNMYECL